MDHGTDQEDNEVPVEVSGPSSLLVVHAARLPPWDSSRPSSAKGSQMMRHLGRARAQRTHMPLSARGSADEGTSTGPGMSRRELLAECWRLVGHHHGERVQFAGVGLAEDVLTEVDGADGSSHLELGRDGGLVDAVDPHLGGVLGAPHTSEVHKRLDVVPLPQFSGHGRGSVVVAVQVPLKPPSHRVEEKVEVVDPYVILQAEKSDALAWTRGVDPEPAADAGV